MPEFEEPRTSAGHGAIVATTPAEPRMLSITVNGRPHRFLGDEISHAQVVRLAHPSMTASPGRSFTVAYAEGPADATNGILAPLRRTRVTEGESFSVFVTDRS